MKSFYHFLSCLLFLLYGPFAAGQAYQFQNYLTNQGQGIKQVSAMIQDSEGYLWFTSEGGGVCRYDGKNYFIFTKKDGLCSDDVRCIYQDSEGNIWFGTGAGISEFKEGVFNNFPEVEGLTKSSVVRIVEDKNKNIWFGSSAGAYKYDRKIFIRYTEKDGLSDIFIKAILCDNKGKLWFGTSGGKIFIYENNIFRKADIIGNITNNPIRSLFEDSKSTIWIGIWGDGVWKYNPGAMGNEYILKHFTENDGLAGNVIYSIYEDKDNNLWFGTQGAGLSKFDGERFTNFNEKEGIGSSIIESIIQDRENNIWVGAYGAGATIMRIMSYELYKKETGLIENGIWTTKEDHSGNIWVGFFSRGISVIINQNDYSDREVLTFPTETQVYYIHIDAQNKIWAGTNDGIEIFRYDSLKKSLKRIKKINKNDGLAGNMVRCFYEDKKSNLWIGTSSGVSLMKANITGNYKISKNYTVNNGLVHNTVFCAKEDDYGNIWFATANGISKFDGNKFQNYTVNEGLVNQDVRSIAKDRNGRLWFATGGGISLYDDKSDTFKNFTSENGLSSDRLYFLQYDSIREVFWAGSAFGLDKFDLGEYNRSGKIIFSHPTAADDFIEMETNTNAVCIDKSGNLWMGTLGGLIKYYPDFISPKNELEPLTHITKIKIDRKDTALLQKSSLPYFLNNISFEFIGISLTIPEKVRYRYMLDGFEKDWGPTETEPFATYSNLPHGDYVFKVIACNNDGVWNKQPVKFGFVITPPFWKTWWFYLLSFLTGSALLYGFIKMRERNLQMEKKILEHKVKMRTAEVIEQKQIIEGKNKDITDSINYARGIQQTILPREDEFKKLLPESFVLFKPKDIVSGDFYWVVEAPPQPSPKGRESQHTSPQHQAAGGRKQEAGSSKGYGELLPPAAASCQLILFAACDCTGHGVPGAFMSMMCNAFLNEVVIKRGISKPSEILDEVRSEIITALKQHGQIGEQKDGMDAALCAWNKETNMLEYSGANNPVWLLRNGEFTEFKPDRQPVGYSSEETKNFTNHSFQLQQGDMIYVFSDGYADQFGGSKGKKFKSSQLKEMLLSIHQKPMEEQQDILNKAIDEWRGNLEQVDDICVIGVRI